MEDEQSCKYVLQNCKVGEHTCNFPFSTNETPCSDKQQLGGSRSENMAAASQGIESSNSVE